MIRGLSERTWLEALEAKETYEANGQRYLKYSVQDQFEAAKCIMEYGFGKPVQPLTGAFQPSHPRSPMDAEQAGRSQQSRRFGAG